jgi:hypothetical protein
MRALQSLAQYKQDPAVHDVELISASWRLRSAIAGDGFERLTSCLAINWLRW